MKFSLILATVNRTQELGRFLGSLDAQTYRDFELIVVDQNPDDRLQPLLEAYRDRFPILHLRSAKGLSRARNVGLKHIKGDIVAFPDDDCWYPEDLLERVKGFFESNPQTDGVTGRAVNEKGRPHTLRWPKQPGWLTRESALRGAVSYTIFLRRGVTQRVGAFNEDLGVGAGTPWGAGEETDYLLRAMGQGFRLYYDPSLTVYHPEPPQGYEARDLAKGYSYGLGMGYVLRAHGYPTGFVLLGFLRTAAMVALDLATGRFGSARFRWYSLLGRIRGWLSK